ncbi:MAG: hypothetical protein SV910_08845 [Chloroflexota bacterium]|nr:hypothetical protein [Chloroflexota bacterium]
MEGLQGIVGLAFKAVALAMAVAVIILSALHAMSTDMMVLLLAVGVLVLALGAIMRSGESV